MPRKEESRKRQRGTGQVLPRGRERWLVRVYVGRDAEGRRKYLSETVHGTKTQAEEKAVELVNRRNRGTLRPRPKKTVDQYLDAWLETTAKPSVRARTLQDYEDTLRRYVRPHLGPLRLSKLSPVEVRGMLVALREKGYSPRTVRKAHECLRNALEQAVSDKLIRDNPARARLVSKALPKKVRNEPATISGERIADFLAVARHDRLYAYWLVLLFGGLRPEEALALRWSDVAGNTARITRVLVDKVRENGPLFEEPKSASSRRAVVMPRIVVVALAERRRRQAEERLAAGPAWQDQGLIFTNEKGGVLWQHQTWWTFRKLREAAEMPKLTPYALRHSCATLLLEKGTPLKIVSERLGHSTIALTADVYSHVTPSMQQAAADTLEGLVSGE